MIALHGVDVYTHVHAFIRISVPIYEFQLPYEKGEHEIGFLEEENNATIVK